MVLLMQPEQYGSNCLLLYRRQDRIWINEYLSLMEIGSFEPWMSSMVLVVECGLWSEEVRHNHNKLSSFQLCPVTCHVWAIRFHFHNH